jgi:hypothetical protein
MVEALEGRGVRGGKGESGFIWNVREVSNEGGKNGGSWRDDVEATETWSDGGNETVDI